jgi:cysteine desulfurase family protein
MNDPLQAPAPREILYLDNSATSYPKPPQVAAAMCRWLEQVGGSPGRSGHRLSIDSARQVFEARESLARLLAVPSSRQIVFTKNATEALNLAIQGLLDPGDRVLTTSMEHNSVMRPLRHLVAQGTITLEVVRCSPEGRLDPADVARALERKTRLVVMTHASNVTGTIMPVPEVAALCREQGALLLVDAAQTAGALPLDVAAWGVDLLAFTGHKSLFGPTGTGGLYLREGVELRPFMRGGTGSNSEQEEQPDFLPDRLESGTLNAVGIAGLQAGLDFVLQTGVGRIREEESALTAMLLKGLAAIPGVTIHGPGSAADMMPVVSLSVAGLAPSEVGYILDEAFGIMTRIGLCCAPSAHRTIGTFPGGTVRLAPGFFTTPADITYTLEALGAIAGKVTRR